MELSADEIARAIGGTVVFGVGSARATSLANDSRTLTPRACFVALVAERDGHDFVQDAFDRGASMALVTRPIFIDVPADRAVVQVDEILPALAALGSLARARLDEARAVGITGSTGKTSTKELTAAALQPRWRVHATPGSFNAEIGLPITLVGAPADTEVLVLELGARLPGDIAALAAVGRPDVGVVTNVGLAHAGLLGGAAGVIREKGSLLAALPADGLAVLDAGDPATDDLAARTEARVVLVSVEGRPTTSGADVRAHTIELDDELRPSFALDTPWGSGRLCVPFRGAHQVTNGALAATVALALDEPFDAVAAGLRRARVAHGRMEILRVASGMVVLDDAYNASPASMAAAIDALRALPVSGRRIAVLGEMRELGDDAVPAHVAVGRLVADAPVDLLVVVGADADAGALADAARAGGTPEVVEAPDAGHALDVVAGRVAGDDAVLVKGSRAVGLDVVVEGLTHGVVTGDDRP
jgi:UDP-N-acetylmuramoyl-tripeptide--D-alanyl-D-alanine ligase